MKFITSKFYNFKVENMFKLELHFYFDHFFYGYLFYTFIYVYMRIYYICIYIYINIYIYILYMNIVYIYIYNIHIFIIWIYIESESLEKVWILEKFWWKIVRLIFLTSFLFVVETLQFNLCVKSRFASVSRWPRIKSVF